LPRGLSRPTGQCFADTAPVIHYAPTENLEHVDVALIDRAEHEIDLAAYVLTDWPVMQALTPAADRGVKVRIYLDGSGRVISPPPSCCESMNHSGALIEGPGWSRTARCCFNPAASAAADRHEG
jgi:phosphatidylserine/phosphatidylglycerophosphate/cardiolipin synthase-like enzyme